VLLGEGDIVPADGVLLEALGLRVDESALSGESVPVDKTANTAGRDINADRSTPEQPSSTAATGCGSRPPAPRALFAGSDICLLILGAKCGLSVTIAKAASRRLR